MSNLKAAQDVQHKFEFYVVALAFTTAAFAMQTGRFSGFALADAIETLSWSLLIPRSSPSGTRMAVHAKQCGSVTPLRIGDGWLAKRQRRGGRANGRRTGQRKWAAANDSRGLSQTRVAHSVVCATEQRRSVRTYTLVYSTGIVRRSRSRELKAPSERGHCRLRSTRDRIAREENTHAVYDRRHPVGRVATGFRRDLHHRFVHPCAFGSRARAFPRSVDRWKTRPRITIAAPLFASRML